MAARVELLEEAECRSVADQVAEHVHNEHKKLRGQGIALAQPTSMPYRWATSRKDLALHLIWS
jgi:hypothetical protein